MLEVHGFGVFTGHRMSNDAFFAIKKNDLFAFYRCVKAFNLLSLAASRLMKPQTKGASNMLIDIHTSRVAWTAEDEAHIKRRVRFALSRFAHRITRVAVRLVDINGPRGGVDKRCRVLIELQGNSPVLVETQGMRLQQLIDRTMERVSHTVRKRIGAITRIRRAHPLTENESLS
jgi:putative sigma-54 modulation protein